MEKNKENTRFRILKQGYDRFQVDAAWQKMEEEIIGLQQKIATYETQLKTYQQQLNSVQTKYETLQQQLALKEKAADEISRLALVEANQVIETAHSNADLIIREALSTARILLVEISNASQQTMVAKKQLKVKLDSLIEMIDQLQLPTLPSIDWLKSIKIE